MIKVAFSFLALSHGFILKSELKYWNWNFVILKSKMEGRQPWSYEEMGRERKFLASWQTNRPLLRYDAGQNVMFCDACSSAKDLGQRYGVETWVRGNRNFKLETIQHHETAKGHIIRLKAYENAKKPTDDTEAGECVKTLTAAQCYDHTYLCCELHYCLGE